MSFMKQPPCGCAFCSPALRTRLGFKQTTVNANWENQSYSRDMKISIAGDLAQAGARQIQEGRAARKSGRATNCRRPELTWDRVFHWLTQSRSACAILPTAREPDPRLPHEEPSPSTFEAPRWRRHSHFFLRRFHPARNAVAEN